MSARTRVDGLLDRLPCGWLAFADDGCITHVNRTLATLLGEEPVALEGRSIETILDVGSRIFYQTHLFPLVRLHGRAEEIFLVLHAAGGEEVGVLANVVRHEDAAGATNECVLMPVRERRKFEDELLRARHAAEEARAALAEEHEALVEQRRVADEANHAKSRFLAVMSHELRTPLNAIGGYLDLLALGIYGPITPAQREAFDRIARGQRRLLGLVNDVLNLSRIEAGRVEYAIADIRLADLVEEILPVVEPQLRDAGLRCEVVVEREVVARADRDKVEQVLINLLSNAIKFTPAGGRVRVDTPHRAGVSGQVFLRVCDTGIGIARDRLGEVFDPFVQVDDRLTRKKEGTGLGLAISRDLARGMGGDLRARSLLGQGSAFTLSLPAGPGA